MARESRSTIVESDNMEISPIPESCALLVIDMQNDYLHEEGICARAGLNVEPLRAVVPIVRRVIEAAHQAKIPVIYTRNWRTRWDISNAQRERVARREFGITGMADTWGAGWFAVQPDNRDVVISKTRHDAFFATNLDQILRSQGVECVVVVGVQTHVCVESTVRSACARDYSLIILKDAVSSVDLEMHTASLGNMAANYGDVVLANMMLAVWDRATA